MNQLPFEYAFIGGIAEYLLGSIMNMHTMRQAELRKPNDVDIAIERPTYETLCYLQPYRRYEDVCLQIESGKVRYKLKIGGINVDAIPVDNLKDKIRIFKSPDCNIVFPIIDIDSLIVLEKKAKADSNVKVDIGKHHTRIFWYNFHYRNLMEYLVKRPLKRKENLQHEMQKKKICTKTKGEPVIDNGYESPDETFKFFKD
uniref:Uncharacterized protein n=1 Tax=viral metagenome TaxID=1070528 RepID=A0A6C0F7M1_9ZZZZ|tara:strand:- start:13762 stop:14361 length:600 start_codon:yes stop_codon:yes gene_type:complete